MNNSQRSGAGGTIGIIVVIIAAIAALVASYKLMPSLFKVLLWVVIGIAVLVIVLVVVLVIAANKSNDKDERTAVGGASDKLNDEQNDVIKGARSQLMELRRTIMKIQNMDIRRPANDVCSRLDKILHTLREQPDEISGARQCLNYYMPTLKKVLDHFLDLDRKGQMTDEISSKTQAFLGDVNEALDKMYNSLFDDDKLNMEVEMEAMTIAIKRDGLLEDKN